MNTKSLPDTPAAGRSSPESPIEAAQVLEDAADLLLVHGRCRGHARTLWNDAGEFCALGAIYEAAGMRIVRRSARAFTAPLVRALRARGLNGDIAFWNNDPATTDDEVRDTLLLVAKELRGQAVPV